MNKRKIARVVIDVALTAMIVAEMFIQFTGVLLHEIIGFAFFATVTVHLLLSARWISKTAGNARKGKMTPRRTALAVMGILLAVNIVVLGISSVAISNLLAQAGLVWTIGSYATWATVHAVSSYTLCALVAIHLAMHWAFLASAFRVPYNPDRRRAIGTTAHAVAAIGAVALGVMAVKEALPQAADASTTGQNEASALPSTADSASGATSESSSSSSSGATSDKGARSGKHKSSSSSNASGNSAQESAPSSSPNGTSTANPSSSASGSTEGSSTATGICTLCRKQCPLSAPKCNKPYQAGLL